jgi:hypothetical protein
LASGGASVHSEGGNSAAFFEPLCNSIARNTEDAADTAQRGAFVIGSKDLLFASRIVSGTAGSLHEATLTIAAAVALFALGGIAVSYGVSAAVITAVSGLCIHALYHSPTTVAEPLPAQVLTETLLLIHTSS